MRLKSRTLLCYAVLVAASTFTLLTVGQPGGEATAETLSARQPIVSWDRQRIIFGDIYGSVESVRRGTAKVLAPVFVLHTAAPVQHPELPPGCDSAGSIVSPLSKIASRCLT